MFYWCIQMLIFSIVFILLVHHLFAFFRDTLTIPKVKDLVNRTEDKYETIYKIISANASTEGRGRDMHSDDFSTPLSQLPHSDPEERTNDLESMKDELRSFLQKSTYASPSSAYSPF